jgi:hypothetical protein
MQLRPPPGRVADLESYLCGQPGHTANAHVWPLITGFIALLLLFTIYLACKWILKKRDAARVQPEASGRSQDQGQLRALARYIDAKTLVFGSFYPLVNYCLASVLMHVPWLADGLSISVSLLHVNNGVLLYHFSRPGTAAYCFSKIKQYMSSGMQACQEYGKSYCSSFLPNNQTPVRGDLSLASGGQSSGRPTVFTVSHGEANINNISFTAIGTANPPES